MIETAEEASSGRVESDLGSIPTAALRSSLLVLRAVFADFQRFASAAEPVATCRVAQEIAILEAELSARTSEESSLRIGEGAL